jgi:hypothetical protein
LICRFSGKDVDPSASKGNSQEQQQKEAECVDRDCTEQEPAGNIELTANITQTQETRKLGGKGKSTGSLTNSMKRRP